MQFPEELQLGVHDVLDLVRLASMKCSSRRNCSSYIEKYEIKVVLPQ